MEQPLVWAADCHGSQEARRHPPRRERPPEPARRSALGHRLLPWVARYSEDADGEFPREWLETFAYGHTASGRPRRITEKLLWHLVESGLVDVFESDDGERTLAIVGWRDFRPVDLTSAERKRRFRRRLYGSLYYGTEGQVTESGLRPRLMKKSLQSRLRAARS